MYQNTCWLLFLILIALGILGYTGYASMQLWKYMRLDQQAPAQHLQWRVVSLNEEVFVPYATYQFQNNRKIYQGEIRWQETYLNEWTAQEKIEKLKKMPFYVWFDSSSPNISSLEKHFPLKEAIYTLILWIIGLYFLGLGYYVKQRFS